MDEMDPREYCESLQRVNTVFVPLSHGERHTKGIKKKGADEYAEEYLEDLIVRWIEKEKQMIRVLFCRFCHVPIGARSDRIKEHLGSRRHEKNKLEAHMKNVNVTTKETNNIKTATDDFIPVNLKVSSPTKTLRILKEENDGQNKLRRHSTGNFITHSSKDLCSDIHFKSENSVSYSLHSPLTNKISKKGSTQSLSPQVLVKWEDFKTNTKNMFTKFRHFGTFTDVTLWCEGKSIKCHRVLLAASSSYFEEMLLEKHNQNNLQSIIYLTGMRFSDIEAIVDFIYNGEFKNQEKNIEHILKAAELLKIKGLVSPPQDQHEDANMQEDGSVGYNNVDNEQRGTHDGNAWDHDSDINSSITGQCTNFSNSKTTKQTLGNEYETTKLLSNGIIIQY